MPVGPRRASLSAYRFVYTTTTNKQSPDPCRSSKATGTCPTIDANSTLKGSTRPAKSPWLETNPKSKHDYKNFLMPGRPKLLQAFTLRVMTVVLRLLEPTSVFEAYWRLDTRRFYAPAKKRRGLSTNRLRTVVSLTPISTKSGMTWRWMYRY